MHTPQAKRKANTDVDHQQGEKRSKTSTESSDAIQPTPQQKHRFNSTSWSYWTEWGHVYALLYSTEPHLQRLGILRVSAWRSRSTLPVAVESTASLLEATLTDNSSLPKPSNSNTSNTPNTPNTSNTSNTPNTSNTSNSSTHESSTSINSIKLLYSSSIARFVNGILDAKQVAGRPIPLTQLAAENSFPQFLVDVRHQVSHYGELPSLHVLRLAADVGLQWLKTMYWERQTNALATLQVTIKEKLLIYKTLMHRLVLDKQNPTTPTSSSTPSNLKNRNLSPAHKASAARIVEVKRCIEEITNISNPNLVHEVLVPLLVGASSKDGKTGNGKDDEAWFLLPKENTGVEGGFTVPQQLLLTWHIAFRKFSEVWSHFPVSLLVSFLEQIVHSTKGELTVDKESSEYRLNSLRTAWVVYLLHNFHRTDPSNTSAAPTSASPTVPLISIANICLKNMNTWTKYILSHICSATGSDTTQQWESLKELTDLKSRADLLSSGRYDLNLKSTKNTPDGNSSLEHNNKLADIHAIEKLLHQAPTQTPDLPKDDTETVWTRSVQYPVSTPIGVLPNGEFPNLDLPSSLDCFEHARFLTPLTNENAHFTTEQSTTSTNTVNNSQPSPPSPSLSPPSPLLPSSPSPSSPAPPSPSTPHQTTKNTSENEENTSDDETQNHFSGSAKHDTVNSLFLTYKELFV